MRSSYLILAIIFLTLALFTPGCSTISSMFQAANNTAGETTVEATWENGQITSMQWRDGKEKKLVKISGKHGDFEFEYLATDVQAFEGQRIAADLHKYLSDNGVKISQSAIQAVLNALSATSVPRLP